MEPDEGKIVRLGSARLTVSRGRLSGVAAMFALIAVVVGAALGPVSSAGAVSAGELYAFGYNRYGQLGSTANNGTGNPNPTPALVSLPGASGQVIQVAAGGDHSLVLTSAGQLYAFGRNSYGQLGSATNNGTVNPSPTPALVGLPGASGQVIQTAAGGEHSLALTSTGQLYAFGLNLWGQLGSATNGGTFNPNSTPALVSFPGASGQVIQIAVGGDHSLALTSTGQLYAFGNNYYGQLGNATNNGTDNPNSTPALVGLPGASGRVVQIAAGLFHSLALTSTGQLYAFGNNYYGQLGNATNNGTENPSPTPALVGLPGASGPVIQIAGGFYHSLALTSTGQPYAFGRNSSGQLGSVTNSGTNNPSPTPALVGLPGASGQAIQIAAGYAHGLALTSTGQLYAFGANQVGELGIATNSGTLNPNPTPARVALPGDATIETIARGPTALHTLVVISNLAVATGSLPDGTAAAAYGAQLQASGGIAPYRWSASGLPVGVSVDLTSGAIAGTPTSSGSYPVSITVTDSYGITASRTLTLTVTPAAVAAVKTLSTSGPVASLTIDCRGTTGQRCAGAWTITTHRRKRGNTIIGVSARPKPKQTTTIVTVANGSYTIPAGKPTTLRLALNATGKRLLNRFWRLPTTLKLTGTLTHSRTLTFTYPKIAPRLTLQFKATRGGYQVATLKLTGLPSGATVEVRCHGDGCPFARRTQHLRSRQTQLALTGVLSRSVLAANTTVRIDVTARDRVGKAFILTTPKTQPRLRCLTPGTHNLVSCTPT